MLGCRDVSFKSPWDCLSTNKRLSLQVYKQTAHTRPANQHISRTGLQKNCELHSNKKKYDSRLQPRNSTTECLHRAANPTPSPMPCPVRPLLSHEDAQDKLKRHKGPPATSRGPGGPLDFRYLHTFWWLCLPSTIYYVVEQQCYVAAMSWQQWPIGHPGSDGQTI